MNSRPLFAIILLAALVIGCHRHVPQTHQYSDTPQGRTAKYVHEHCWKLRHFPTKTRWDSNDGKLVTEKNGDTQYACPGIDNYIVIYENEEQP